MERRLQFRRVDGPGIQNASDMSLRILHVTPYFTDAWAYGGIPRLATTLTTGLTRRGHHVTVCTTDACDRHSRLPTRPLAPAPSDIDVHVFRNWSNRLAYELQLFTPIGLGRYLADSGAQFDIAHIHGHRHLLERGRGAVVSLARGAVRVGAQRHGAAHRAPAGAQARLGCDVGPAGPGRRCGRAGGQPGRACTAAVDGRRGAADPGRAQPAGP